MSSYLVGTNREHESNLLVQKAINFIVMISIPSAFGLFLLSDYLICILVGDTYTNAILPMKILSPVIFFMAFASIICSVILTPLKLEYCILKSQIIGLLLNVMLNFALIQKYKAIGAAIATMLTECIVMLLLFYYSKDKFVNKHFLLNTFKTLVSTLCVISLLLMTKLYIRNYYLYICFSIVFGSIIFFGLLKVLKHDLLTFNTIKIR